MKFSKRFWQLIRPYQKLVGASIVFNIFMVVFSLVSITSLIPILKIIFENSAIEADPVPWTGIRNIRPWLESWLNTQLYYWQNQLGNSGLLARVLIMGGVLMLLKNLFRYLATACLVPLQNGVERDLRKRLHTKFLDLSPSYFADTKKGDLLSRLTTDVQEVQWAMLSSAQRLVRDPFMIVLTLVLLVILSPQLTFFAAIALPIAGATINAIGQTLSKPARRARAAIGTLLSAVEEHLNGLVAIQSMNGQREAEKLFARSNDDYFRQMNKVLWRSELSSPISETLGSLVIIGTIWFGGQLIFANEGLEPAVFITYIALFYQIITPAKSISTALYNIKRGAASAERIWQVLETEDGLIDPAMPRDFPKGENGFEISLNNVTFAYEAEPALTNINLTIEAGKTIALVGSSGSGKTTLSKLLCRFYDPTSGQILLDGVALSAFAKFDVRQAISLVPQEPFLFHATIYENLTFGEVFSEEKIWEALEQASAADFVRATSSGLWTVIGDQGMKLSGGQRQRIALARVLLRSAPMIILDEATSALDSENEYLIKESFAKALVGKTAIIIAHRLSTVQDADEIVVLHEGRIIEKGNHEELLDQGGRYAQMVQLQSLS